MKNFFVYQSRDGVDVKPGKMSGPHFFIKPGGSVAMSSTTALHAVNE